MLAFWSLIDVHAYLGIGVRQGPTSDWIYRQSPRWERILNELYGADQVVHSSWVSSQSTRKRRLPPSERCLGAPSVSTLGLVTLLSRWAFQSPQAGGSVDKDVVANAYQLLCQFVRLVVGDADCVLVSVRVDADWRPRWPRPEDVFADAASSFTMQLRSDGGADFADLLRVARIRGRASTAGEWWRALARHMGAGTMIPLATIVRACSSKYKMTALSAQVFCDIALRAERCLGSHVREGQRPLAHTTKRLPLTFAWAKTKSFGPFWEVDCAIATHILAARGVVNKPLHFSVAIDKGTPCGLPVYLSLLALPENVGVICAPQV